MPYFTVIITGLLAWPDPSLVFVKATTSLYDPTAKLFALLFIDTVTWVLVFAPNTPPDEERLIQGCSLLAVQVIGVVPVFVRV